MSENNAESQQYVSNEDYTVRVRDTILNCKVEGMQTTAKSVVKIELHLASIAQSLAAIAESLSTIERLKMIE